jgi:hypothetical protein
LVRAKMKPPATTISVADKKSRAIGSRSHRRYSKSAADSDRGTATIGSTASQEKGSKPMPNQLGTATSARNGARPTNRPSASHSIWRRVRASRAATRHLQVWRMMPKNTDEVKSARSSEATAGHHASAPRTSAVPPEQAIAASMTMSRVRIERSRSGKIRKKRAIRKGSAAPAARRTTCSVSSAAAVRFGTAAMTRAAAASRRKVAASRRRVLQTVDRASASPARPTVVRAR